MTAADLDSFHYKTVFISDLHLGSGKTSSPYLYEFLKHLDYKQLKDIYMIGDVIGGWEHEGGKTKAMPEMEKRIMDILNYAADNGVRVHYIPGNHDEKMRPLVDGLQSRRDFKIFSKNFLFENDPLYETGGSDSKKFKVLHGDGHDPSFFSRGWFRPVAKKISAAYDSFVRVDQRVSKMIHDATGAHVSGAKVLKSGFKKIVGFVHSQKSLLNSLKNEEYDGIIMGHTHIAGAGVLDINGRKKPLINDGDWVEGTTYAYVEKDGELPKPTDYKAEREKRGFGTLPGDKDEHPAQFQAYRAQTDRQVQLINQLWPQRNRKKQQRKYEEAIGKAYMLQVKKKDIGEALTKLKETGSLSEETLHMLKKAVDKDKKPLHKKQKDGLKAIFNKYAANDFMEKDDRAFVKTLLRDFMTHADRKIEKEAEIIRKTGHKLDYQMSA